MPPDKVPRLSWQTSVALICAACGMQLGNAKLLGDTAPEPTALSPGWKVAVGNATPPPLITQASSVVVAAEPDPEPPPPLETAIVGPAPDAGYWMVEPTAGLKSSVGGIVERAGQLRVQERVTVPGGTSEPPGNVSLQASVAVRLFDWGEQFGSEIVEGTAAPAPTIVMPALKDVVGNDVLLGEIEQDVTVVVADDPVPDPPPPFLTEIAGP